MTNCNDLMLGGFICVSGEKYIVGERVGSGGQGAVWRVSRCGDNKIYALKVIGEKVDECRKNKMKNIERLIGDKLGEKLRKTEALAEKRVKYALPISCEQNLYVMEYVKGRTLDSLFADGSIEKMTLEDKLILAQRIAQAIASPHANGYCYSDINLQNFMLSDEDAFVIDCENISSTDRINSGECCFTKGTGFFVAPEVAFGKAKVSPYSDDYALATLIFRVLLNNALSSAYYGIAMYEKLPPPADMAELAELAGEADVDPNWVHFVFDAKNRSNGIRELAEEAAKNRNVEFKRKLDDAIKIWDELSEGMRDLFNKAFIDPFDPKSRPMAST